MKRNKKNKEKTDEHFVKMYVDDTMSMMGFFGKHAKLMNALLKRIDWDNKLILVKHTKESIAEECEMKLSYLEKCLSELKQKDIINTLGRSIYMVNPTYFGKGDFDDIKELRVVYTYNKNGKTITVEKEKESLELKELHKETVYKNGMTDSEVRRALHEKLNRTK